MIPNFGIKNFRSFDDKGVFLDNLQKVNIFIGKNNSGKSNFLRFLNLLTKHYSDPVKFPSSDYENNHRKQNEHTVLTLELKHNDLNYPERVLINSRYEKTDTIIPDPFKVDFTLSMHGDTSIKLTNFDGSVPNSVLKVLQKGYSHAERQFYIDQIKADIYKKVHEKLRLFREIVYISDFRLIQEGNSFETSNSDLKGSNIISKMFVMQNPDTGHENEREKFNKIQDVIRKLLSINDLTIEIPHTKDKILLLIHGNRQPLSSYGSGIHQLIILCCALIIYSERIICIEEPEIHLHPELQRKFLDFLIHETNNTYFITTHSNTFLNQIKDISIYHIQYNGISSTCQKIQNTQTAYHLLDDLGYKASDLLQSNGVIWVEGPSDRNFVKKWINLIDPALEEGLHYSIMFYGGRMLANCSFDFEFFESNLIPLLKINKNAFVLIDKDSKNNNQINDTKGRIKQEIGDKNCWITKGKEIENYIAEGVIKKWLISKNAYNENIVNQNETIKFSDVISEIDLTHKIKYDLNKSGYSYEIANLINSEDLDYLDLKQRLKELIAIIHQWNDPTIK